ncbi:autotransporter assembly complex family protein [Pseudovibrio sp. Tun.PSC04-5.I4]|uniref:autotransporter assembly complex protein TamA n=1 Tax=Pseudovibrio sp. Tun.PSC04-5.I4 TaxID=1798213 RepID=UPI00088941DF|nr:autotransporter assembly complex family protein [Pseudovibrio sp. Tun.PSC04-5.I4]SDQ92067.1 autotransporter secretion outer membrane protein TamA [Pseudovibrio sp. Tun.PSC04-5.I4]
MPRCFHAWRRLCAASLLAIALVLCISVRTEAFELFGYHLWGEKSESAEDSSVGIPDPTPYTVDFHVKGESAEEVSDTESDLQSASLLVQDIKQLPSGTSGVLARATKDFERLIGKLYEDGYYGALVTISVAGMPLNQAVLHLEKITERPVPVHIEVDRGPLFHFGEATLSYRGPVSSQGLQLPAAQSADLLEGDPALSAKVLNAEARAVKAVKDNGYPFAKVGDRSLLANHASQTLKVTLVIDSGPYAKFGPVTVSGTENMDAGFVQQYADIPQGAQWDTKILSKAENRVRGLEVFSSVRMQPADSVGPDGELPLEIIVVERPRKVFGFGANYSSNEGVGVEGYWRHRNLFGKAERLSVAGTVGQLLAVDNEQIEYSARVTFEKPGIFDPTTSFSTSLAAVQENPDNFRSQSISYDAYLQKDFDETLSGRAGGEIFYANERDVFGDNDYFFISIPAELTYDTRNNKLNPIRGVEAKVFFEPAYDLRGDEGIFFSQGSISSYLPIVGTDRVVLAGRVSAGAIVAPSVQDVPASRRFFLGGGGTIRGYAYKNVGPRLNGEVIGGRSFILFNGEIRTRITENIGVVGFIDAGAAFETQLPSFDNPFSIGVGGGLRYFTPVGPLRLDIGVPLEPEQNDPPFVIYVGLSQAF